MIINRAILHVLDFSSGVSIFSEEEVDLTQEASAEYIGKLFGRIHRDASGKRGTFAEDSEYRKDLGRYRSGELGMADFSVKTAREIQRQLSMAEGAHSADILFADYTEEESRFFGFLLLKHHVGYTHRAANDGGHVRAEIMQHFVILPKPSQKLDSWAVIQMDSEEILFSDKERMIDGRETALIPEILLKCSSSVSGKEAIKTMESAAAAVAEKHGENPVEAVLKMKSFMLENAEVSEILEPKELVREVFAASEEKQAEFLSEMEEKSIPSSVQVERRTAVNAAKKHKIKTDTGIEISIPCEYFENPDYVEFINNPDGTISIQLRRIGQIINR